ncbi:MAG: PilZ domain-containing protein [Candidatus Krumholzibacteriota bacterium]
MLLETLNALDSAGARALQSTCGLDVTGREVSLVREGRQGFLTLGTLRLKGCALQMVHLGCDEKLSVKLAEASADRGNGPGMEGLAGSFLTHLLEKFEDRNPRGTVENLQEAPVTLHTRGVRTFQFRLDTGQGQLFYLAEVPSRTEMAIVKGSEFLTSMESIYLPDDWRRYEVLPDHEALDGFLTFLRKTEGDVYLEAPAGDGTATINAGLLVEICQVQDRSAMKLITDFSHPDQGVPAPGSIVQASVGIGDRSLEFEMAYLAPASHELASGSRLPCAMFSLPRTVTVGQRRRSFRVSVSESIKVEMQPALGQGEISPWSDTEIVPEIISGRLADLSFSGARINADGARQRPGFQRDNRVVCRLFFPDMEEPIQVQGVIRRSAAGPVNRNQGQDDIGIEFIVPPDSDRTGLDYIRQFVLQVQRSKLAQRLLVTGT